MKLLKSTSTLFILSIVLCLTACDKKLLDHNSDTNHLVISSLDDAQALMDNMQVMSEMPGAGEISADDIYLPDSAFSTISANEFNTYTWQPDIYQGRGYVEDWDAPYRQVFYANTVLETLPRLNNFGNQAFKNRIEGSAYFIRGLAFFQIAQLFAGVYKTGSENDMGIPLRLTSDPEIASVRSSLYDTYQQIIHDINMASALLPAAIDNNRKNRPSQAAAFGLLARIYLVMGDYVKALKFADSSLSRYVRITDYNTAIQNIHKPFPLNQEEVIYQAHLLSTIDILDHAECYIDSNLYKNYNDNDLRKDLFFKLSTQGFPMPCHSYTSTNLKFAGLACDEIILIKAECEARLGRIQEAIDDLNMLLVKRIRKGSFKPLLAGTLQEVLGLVLIERRKELVLRGLRWSDIRRLNRENPVITLTRECKGQKYILAGNDPRFVLPIPPDVIRLSGIAQNPR